MMQIRPDSDPQEYLGISGDGDDALLAAGVRLCDGDARLAVVPDLSDALPARPDYRPRQLVRNRHLFILKDFVHFPG